MTGRLTPSEPAEANSLTEAERQEEVEILRAENARLAEELRASRQQQTATGDVLKLIGQSAFDLQGVIDKLVTSATRLCNLDIGALWLVRDGFLHLAASTGNTQEWVDFRRSQPQPLVRNIPSSRAALTGKIDIVSDILEDAELMTAYEFHQRGNYRATLNVPLLREGTPTAVLSLARREPGPFSARQLELVSAFADQAVIAIENSRLVAELDARTRELSESLLHQTGSGNILRVIASSPTDVGPVLAAIARNAYELCAAQDVAVVLRDGNDLLFSAHHGPIPIGLEKWPISRRWTAGRAVVDRVPIHVHDLLAESEEFPDGRELAVRMGHRSILSVPLLKDGDSIGAIILRRTEVKPFSDKQIALLQTFADQAVIAIQNVRLFEELQQSLQRQTATAEVLKVISRSAFDLEIVLDTLIASAAQLCGADMGFLFRLDGDVYTWAAAFGFSPDRLQRLRSLMAGRRVAPGRGSILARTVQEGRPVHVLDVLVDDEYEWSDIQAIGGYRTALGIPLLRDGITVGVLTLTRGEVRAFAASEVELATTFADQAVIAIENVRLFKEVQARTESLSEALQQQTATADVLKTISRSTFDLRTVLHTLVESAARLCDAEQASITRPRDGVLYRAEFYGFSDEFIQHARHVPVEPDPGSVIGRALLEGRIVHIPDVEADPAYTWAEAKKLGGFRTILGVPMMREGTAIGVLTLSRSEPRPFTDRQIELVSTFADQAAIAIENVRLFEQVQARTGELARSLEELRAAQDRLVETQKLAALGQLTAGVAHEIKNPLNFINNFADLSAELAGELVDALRPPLADGAVAEASDLAATIRANLHKVVEHGRRADSIVKNMLLHSREGSGARREIDLNATAQESLNLAYHGARAEHPSFNVRLSTALDPDIGSIDAYPQELVRVLLNLISNAFHAVHKRQREGDDPSFDPEVTVSTRALPSGAEIRVRDNGTGIPDDVRVKMFDPFFTTKPPGEGTGLGLSLSHDIVVKQHGGRIDVDSVLGEFTEFVITLPRGESAREADQRSAP